MSTSTEPRRHALASSLRFEDDKISVDLEAGRVISVPIEWFPRLRDATPAQLANWHLIGGGIGVRWEDLDEDLSVKDLLSV